MYVVHLLSMKMNQKTKEIINKALQTVPLALECYAPDGGYPEGFGYWSYGTSYQVMLNDALESSLGHDAGLSDYPFSTISPATFNI